MAEAAREERRRALFDLLDRPVVDRAAEPDAYRRVYLHEEYLRSWFQARPGWRLLGGEGSYRLERVPAQALAERGLPRLRAPLDYACLCWVLWFAEVRAADPRRWFVLSELAAEVARAGGASFRLAERAHREALVRSLQLLVDLGALIFRDGQAERWVGGEAELGGPVEVLYEFAEDAPRLLAAFDPAGLDAWAAPAAEGPALPRSGEAVPPAARAWRALLLGPALWVGDDPEALAAVAAAEAEFRGDLDPLGCVLERTAEHARLWRTGAARGQAGAVLLDLLPESAEAGADRHVRYVFHPVLLLLAAVRAEMGAGRLAPGADGTVPVGDGTLHDLFLDLCRRHRRNWGAELGEQVRVEEIWGRLLRQMRQMGLLRGPDALGRCWLLPAAARLAGTYADAPPPDPDPGLRAQPRSLLPEGGDGAWAE